MELLANLIDLLVHLDRYLATVIREYGLWTYLILFLIIFCETGLVVTPMLPGDSLLFTAGALAATGALEVGWLLVLLTAAAIAGDTANYRIGYFIGPKVFEGHHARFLKKEYLERTHRFYEKHGGKTIVIARFLPIIRTFAPFVAGVASMTYWRFATYNVLGGIIWIALFVLGGYYFGNLALVKSNFALVIAGIILISFLPGAVELWRSRRAPA